MESTGDAADGASGCLRNLAAWFRLAIGHFDMLRAIRVAFKRLVATEVEFLGRWLAERPLAGPERRRSMVEQTRDVEDFLFCIAHGAYPIQQIIALHESRSALQQIFQAKLYDRTSVGSPTQSVLTRSIRKFN